MFYSQNELLIFQIIFLSLRLNINQYKYYDKIYKYQLLFFKERVKFGMNKVK